ncbi:unnamed protein product [Peniophora sp. CBMAI 1063]|nr:unnamed protein product [Peniophora sp. CBMAI 1063]
MLGCIRISTPTFLWLALSAVGRPADSYSQCGGMQWTGVTECIAGYACTHQNDQYSQCIPDATFEEERLVVDAEAATPLTTPSASLLTAVAPSSTFRTSSAASIAVSSATTSASSSTTTSTIPAPTTPPSKAVGRLPALGWNGWNAYGCDISADKVLAAAQSFVDLGLADVGYEYVNIDDCWMLESRDATTQQQVPDPDKFPDGIAAVADAIHNMGLKIGIYSDAGTSTCGGYPGGLGYETIDAAVYDSWGIDYLKYDNCNVPSNWSDTPDQGDDYYNSKTAIRYRIMGAALAENETPVQYSLCLWGVDDPWEWGAKVGHSWRMDYDAQPDWSYITQIMTKNARYLDAITFYAHNDMDMMEIGNGNFTVEEERTHFAAWILMKSPILLGTDLSKLSSDQVAIVSNPALLAFHQDSSVGEPAKPFTSSTSDTTSPPSFYAGTSSKGTHLFIVNLNDTKASYTVNFADVPGLGLGSYVLQDMWTGKNLGNFSGNYTASVAAHDTVAILATNP